MRRVGEVERVQVRVVEESEALGGHAAPNEAPTVCDRAATLPQRSTTETWVVPTARYGSGASPLISPASSARSKRISLARCAARALLSAAGRASGGMRELRYPYWRCGTPRRGGGGGRARARSSVAGNASRMWSISMRLPASRIGKRHQVEAAVASRIGSRSTARTWRGRPSGHSRRSAACRRRSRRRFRRGRTRPPRARRSASGCGEIRCAEDVSGLPRLGEALEEGIGQAFMGPQVRGQAPRSPNRWSR